MSGSHMFTIKSNGLAVITTTVLAVVVCTPFASAVWLLYRVWMWLT